MNVGGIYRSFLTSTPAKKALVILGLLVVAGSFAACASARSDDDGAGNSLSNGGSKMPYRTNLELK